MQVKILSPEKSIFEGEVHLVQVPGTNGSFEVLNNHAPIVSTLEKGKIKVITSDGEVMYFDIEGGFVKVQNNVINVLID